MQSQGYADEEHWLPRLRLCESLWCLESLSQGPGHVESGDVSVWGSQSTPLISDGAAVFLFNK